ncbi:hypothetical protein BX666DRAFT_2108574, partial [Dichotomocladium elegans]
MEKTTSTVLNIATFGQRAPSVLGSAENNNIVGDRRVDSNDSKPFVAAENRTSPRLLVRPFKSPSFDDENSCPSLQNADSEKSKLLEFPIIHHSLTTTHQRHKIDKTRQRPSVGGKSVAAIRQLSKAGAHKRDASGRQLSTEQLKLLSRRIDPSAPLSSPHASPSKPALPQSLSPHVYHNSSPDATIAERPSLVSAQSSLFQTCTSLWTGSQPQIDYLHYDNVKQLSELLKTRLTQAKYRALDSFDPSSHHRTDYYDIDSLHLPKRRRLTPFTHKRHQLSLAVSGNGRNLFNRKRNGRRRFFPPQPTLHLRPLQPALAQEDEEEGNNIILAADDTCKASTPVAQQRSPAPTRGRKANANKRKLAAERTPKRNYSSKTILPVVLEDGSRVFVCEPCGKRYKNRNGLTYHLDRCRYRQEEEENSQQQDELLDEDHVNEIDCICNTSTKDRGTVIQCEKCQTWQHTECVVLEQDSSTGGYVCARCLCNDDSESSQQNPHERIEEEEDELEEDDDSACGQPADITSASSSTAKETAVPKSADEDIFCPSRHGAPATTIAHEWDGDNIQQKTLSEPWGHTAADSQEDTPFSSFQDPAFQPWNMSDLGLINPPSLLFSDSTAFDDDSNLAFLDVVPTDTSPADALWFEFANFEDDYHCDEL